MCGNGFTIKVGWEPSQMVIHSFSQSVSHSVSQLVSGSPAFIEVEYTYSKVHKSNLMDFCIYTGITTIWIKI